MEVQQQQQQWIRKHNFVSQISELLDQYLHQSTGSFALNPKLPITASSSSSSSSADSSTYLAWESEKEIGKKIIPQDSRRLCHRKQQLQHW
jgi:hypothetical protein